MLSQKSVGLSKSDKKYLKFIPFPESKKKEFVCGSNYFMAQEFYRSFKHIFGNGYRTVNLTSPTGSQTVDIPNLSGITPCLVMYHFSVELMLKALIHLYCPETNVPRHHNLTKLLNILKTNHPERFSKFLTKDQELIVDELGEACIQMRYGEGTICLSPNKYDDVGDKKPQEEFSKLLNQIFHTLDKTFKAHDANKTMP